MEGRTLRREIETASLAVFPQVERRAGGQIRTDDLPITSRLRFQLRHAGGYDRPLIVQYWEYLRQVHRSYHPRG